MPSNTGIRKLTDAQFWKDLGERVLWTGAQAGLAVITVEQFELPAWAVPALAAGLAFAKSWVAKQIGNTNSASTVPGV
jgi:hypothetical protein